MVVIKWILLNIVFLLSVSYYPQNLTKSKNISAGPDQPLRIVLEKIRETKGINFVYDDNLISNIKVPGKIDNNLDENTIKKILAKYDISYKIFPNKSFVLYRKKKPVKEVATKAIVIKQAISITDTVHIVTMPFMISNVSLDYPPIAVKNDLEGIVTVRFLVDKNGDVTKTRIASSSGTHILDSAAVDYLMRSKFIPARENGVPQNIWLSLIFKYIIRR